MVQEGGKFEAGLLPDNANHDESFSPLKYHQHLGHTCTRTTLMQPEMRARSWTPT